jgi:hypothetical protein
VSPWLLLAAIFAVLIFLGLCLDEIGIIPLCVPAFIPIMDLLGFDRLWFGILFPISAQMAYITPPFAYTLFQVSTSPIGALRTQDGNTGGTGRPGRVGHEAGDQTRSRVRLQIDRRRKCCGIYNGWPCGMNGSLAVRLAVM